MVRIDTFPRMTRSALLAVVFAAGLLPSHSLWAAGPPIVDTLPPTAPAMSQASVIIEAGVGRVITLPAPVANVFVSDPKIVEVRPASPTSLFMFGVAAGRTTVAALDANGQTVRQFEITVRPSAAASNDAQQAIAKVAPRSAAHVEAQGKRLVVSGRAATPAEAQAAVSTAQGYAVDGQTVDNQLRVSGDIQVGLRVRIAEISRSVTRALGVNWQAIGNVGKLAVNLATNAALPQTLGSPNLLNATYNSGGGNSINSLIDALANDNLIHLLAEPNLTAMTGEAASFLVGGEFPVPIAQQGGTISVEYKQYGVALAFVPTVMSGDRIRIKVRPEVSQLTSQGAVQISIGATALSIPALTVRRAETTIELGSGQSFAMAGLLMDNTNDTVNAFPGIGELPILGALFRSDAFIRNETELVIIVTPYITRPVSDPSALRAPTDGFRPPTDLERLLMLRQVGRGTATHLAQRLPGQAGFIVE
jgi:pilus assembly protein CpaC